MTLFRRAGSLWASFRPSLPGPMKKKRELGSHGEALALQFLKANGYRILEKNFKTKFGEIDVVAKDGPTLCFVEIKTRRSLQFGWPEEGVGLKKQWRLSRLARGYIRRYGLADVPMRFDVVSILVHPDGSPDRTRLIKGAFDAA